MSEDGEDDEYTFVYSEDAKLESSQGTKSADQQKGEKEPIDKAEQVEDSEEEERPTLNPMDEEVFEVLAQASGLRPRRPQPSCNGPCGAGCGNMYPVSFDPLGEADTTFEEEYARLNSDLDEEPANSHRWRAWLSMCFLVLITGPAIAAFFLTAKEWVDPLIRFVPADDAEQVKEIFFGGTAWLVSCVTNKSATKPPKVLEAAAQVLRPRGVRVARVHCWHPLDTKKGKRTLAERFGFRNKPPVVMATTGKGPPTFVAATGLPADALAAKVLAAVIPDAEAPKAFVKDRKQRRDHSGRVDSVGRRPEKMEEEHYDSEQAAEVVQDEEDVNLDEA